jgi:LacI family transcriptional regulator
MGNLRILSSAEQVAKYLREELANRVWSGMMPGGDKLARELGVGSNTIEAALKMLENEGWLVNQGRRSGRLINLKERASTEGGMRVCILLGESSDRHQAFILEFINALNDAGHTATFASQSQDELGNNPERIGQFVEKAAADAWVVFSALRDVLEWFEQSGLPCFALAGRANNIKIPSIAPDKITPLRAVIKRLSELGHQRIVLICRPMRRIPEPGLFETAFLEELEKIGIQTGPYNLPNWDENIEDFHRSLDSLFRLTPPTALLIDESPFVTAALQFCIRAGLKIPEDFSLICTDSDSSFSWCQPSIAHISWESGPITRRIVNWANAVVQGKKDDEKSFFKSKFIEGDTVGLAP